VTDTAGDVTGYELTRFNALQHGVLSRYTVLPWESESEYLDLLHALADEHQPLGPTEEHLVEELAGILWRKRRLRLAEAAAFRRGLAGTRSSYAGMASASVSHRVNANCETDVAAAIQATSEDTQADFADLAADEAQTSEAVQFLVAGGDAAYSEALARLREDTRGWWREVLVEPDENREPYTPDAASLVRFLQEEVAGWYENRRKELEQRPLIQSQAFGEALAPDRLEKLSRYEVHLDRKLERTLAMLLKLQELRRSSAVLQRGDAPHLVEVPSCDQ
jgi:hypothetical protein